VPTVTREEIMETLTLEQIEQLTDLPAPHGAEPSEERAYRELAWENIKVDVESRDAQVPIDADADERA
jgi:hypothetical protein